MKAPCRAAWLLAGLLGLANAQAQWLTEDKDWQEGTVPEAPAFTLSRLLPVEVRAGSELRFGIEPSSVSIGSDGVVRYVLVAQSASGALNVVYEGLRCRSGEVKTYARWNPNPQSSPVDGSADGTWRPADRAEWRSLFAAGARPALALARQGVCDGPTPNAPVSRMLRDLRQGKTER